MITKNVSIKGHENVLLLTFGSGDIMFSKLNYADGTVGIAFSEMPARKIGDETDEFSYGGLEKIPNISLIMDFNKPESISALIHSLIEIQKTLFNK